MSTTKPQQYQCLLDQMEQLLEGERDFVVNAALAASLVYFNLPRIQWAGFYMRRGDELVVGPFQGRPASTHIPIGQGVCGMAAARREVITLDDLRPDERAIDGNGHSAAQNEPPVSQIVAPLLDQRYVRGVLQLDSQTPGRFDPDDRQGLQRVARMFVELTDFPE